MVYDDDSRRQLDGLRTECGCRAGGVTLAFSVSAYGLWAWMNSTSRGMGPRLLAGAEIGLVAAVAGKLLGILWARYRYVALRRRLLAEDRPARPRVNPMSVGMG